jgi:hypothetical protein
VFENRVLRRIFGPKREEVTRGWRRLRNEKLYNLYASSNIIRVVESRRVGWTGYVAWMGAMINAKKKKNRSENLMGKEHS